MKDDLTGLSFTSP